MPPEDAVFLEQVTELICRRGLRLPVLAVLEAGRPLAFLGGQFLWVAEPVLSLLLPGQLIRRCARLLETPSAVAGLVYRLEKRGA